MWVNLAGRGTKDEVVDHYGRDNQTFLIGITELKVKKEVDLGDHGATKK